MPIRRLPTVAAGGRSPEAEAELEPAQARTGVRPVRAIEGPPYKFTHRQTGADGFVYEECVLAVREDHMCAPAHG